MKAKPIINELNFNKLQKQTLFIVRPKPSQAKLQQPSMATRELKTSVLCDTLQKSIEQSMVCLQQQISQQKVMDKISCQRIKECLAVLRQKCSNQQQSSSQNRKVQTSIGLLRKQSSKYFTRYKLQINEDKNKENLQTEPSPVYKTSKSKSNKEDSQIYMQELQMKIQQLSSKVELYESEYESLGAQIKKLQTDIEKQIKQKAQMMKILQLKQSNYKKLQNKLRENIQQLEDRQAQTQKKLEVNQGWLRQRQSQILTFWQVSTK